MWWFENVDCVKTNPEWLLGQWKKVPKLSQRNLCYKILGDLMIISKSAFYTVHPSLWTRVTTWWFSTFLAPAIKHKIHNIHEVTYSLSNHQPNLWTGIFVAGERAWFCDQLNRVWHSYVHTGPFYTHFMSILGLSVFLLSYWSKNKPNFSLLKSKLNCSLLFRSMTCPSTVFVTTSHSLL